MRIALRTTLQPQPSFPSMEQLPPAMQKAYRRIARRFSARPTVMVDSATTIVPKLRSRIIVNDNEFHRLDELPADYRRMYEQILARTLPLHDAVCTVVKTERSDFIKGTIALAIIAASLAAGAVYLWMHGYFA